MINYDDVFRNRGKNTDYIEIKDLEDTKFENSKRKLNFDYNNYGGSGRKSKDVLKKSQLKYQLQSEIIDLDEEIEHLTQKISEYL